MMIWREPQPFLSFCRKITCIFTVYLTKVFFFMFTFCIVLKHFRSNTIYVCRKKWGGSVQIIRGLSLNCRAISSRRSWHFKRWFSLILFCFQFPSQKSQISSPYQNKGKALRIEFHRRGYVDGDRSSCLLVWLLFFFYFRCCRQY